MALTAARVTVSTVAVALNTASSGGQVLYLKNTSANAADLGPSTVAAGAGLDLAAGASLQVTVDGGDVLFAIRTAAADATIAVLREL